MPKADRYHKTFPVTWEQLHRDAKALAWRLLERGSFTKIVAVTRGGLIPAGIIARELNIRHIDTACIMLYNYREEGDAETVLKNADPSFNTPDTLIIDDLVDTGHTAQILRAALPKAHFAVLYAKPEGLGLVDTYVTELSQDTWVLFPWDSDIQYARPIIDLQKKEEA
ncbi:xanthine phosphoribosyltransferase [Mailhella massiliensis]|uniref:Xanthine phosphoribosyltransferase n=1 Tax=Mailhella massiliensis TaxID=1903261 RepID=A0A921AY85_9BACT|nr:xanthine phosphoribosyltransferase [Mailhella massiliensis]HJD98289.1 xanthine phosphoribosyltransferase [Mailhella massiliensis]